MRLLSAGFLAIVASAAGGCGGSLMPGANGGTGGGSGGASGVAGAGAPGSGSGGASGVAGAGAPGSGSGGFGTGSAGSPGGSLDAGGSSGGGGGAGAGDAGLAGADAACLVTYSSPFDTTVRGCNVSISVWSSQGFTITLDGPIPGSADAFNLSVIVLRPVAPGTYDASTASSGRDGVAVPLRDPPDVTAPVWSASFGNDAGAVGSLSVTLTALGDPTLFEGATFYEAPHGSVTASMVEEAGGLPNLQQTITF